MASSSAVVRAQRLEYFTIAWNSLEALIALVSGFLARIVGACFVALALYVAYDSTHALWMREAPHRSIAGIALTAVSVVAMPILARAKRQAAAALNSGAMRADARQTEFCMYLSAIVLGGLLLNALLGWWWADPLAGLAMVPIIGKEGIDALRGKACCGDGCH
ncbi:MAG: cation transporter [Candidatus Solibacter sp.]|nr:cation transporter [Candidatus Solibacter sp.]